MRAATISIVRWTSLLAVACNQLVAASGACGAPTEPTEPNKPNNNTLCRPPYGIYGAYAPSVGTLRARAIFVDFPDAPATVSPSDVYSLVENGPADLYKTISYGKLDLEIAPHLDQFFRMPSNSTSYSYSRGLTSETHRRYVEDAVAAAGNSVDFSGSDVLYIFPVRTAYDISFSTAGVFSIVTADNTTFPGAITFGQDLYDYWGFKTINHETGHAMGLPDLYPYGEGQVEQWVGGFNLMGLISGQSPDFFAIHKWQLGWIDDNQVDCVEAVGKTTHTITPVEVADTRTKLVMIPINGNVSVVAEVRSTQGLDSEACGTGVLIYTSHGDLGTGQGPVRVIDSTPNSQGCKPEIGGELNDAPFSVGKTYDGGLGVTITVQAQEDNNFVIEVDRTA